MFQAMCSFDAVSKNIANSKKVGDANCSVTEVHFWFGKVNAFFCGMPYVDQKTKKLSLY